MQLFQVPSDHKNIMKVKKDWSLILRVSRRDVKSPTTVEEISAWHRQHEIAYKMRKIWERENKARKEDGKKGDKTPAKEKSHQPKTNWAPASNNNMEEPDVAECGVADKQQEGQFIDSD